MLNFHQLHYLAEGRMEELRREANEQALHRAARAERRRAALEATLGRLRGELTEFERQAHTVLSQRRTRRSIKARI